MLRYLQYFSQSDNLRASQLDALKLFLTLLIIRIFRISKFHEFGIDFDLDNYIFFLHYAFLASALFSFIYMLRLCRGYIDFFVVETQEHLTLASSKVAVSEQQTASTVIKASPHDPSLTNVNLRDAINRELNFIVILRGYFNVFINVIDVLIALALTSSSFFYFMSP